MVDMTQILTGKTAAPAMSYAPKYDPTGTKQLTADTIYKTDSGRFTPRRVISASSSSSSQSGASGGNTIEQDSLAVSEVIKPATVVVPPPAKTIYGRTYKDIGGGIKVFTSKPPEGAVAAYYPQAKGIVTSTGEFYPVQGEYSGWIPEGFKKDTLYEQKYTLSDVSGGTPVNKGEFKFTPHFVVQSKAQVPQPSQPSSSDVYAKLGLEKYSSDYVPLKKEMSMRIPKERMSAIYPAKISERYANLVKEGFGVKDWTPSNLLGTASYIWGTAVPETGGAIASLPTKIFGKDIILKVPNERYLSSGTGYYNPSKNTFEQLNKNILLTKEQQVESMRTLGRLGAEAGKLYGVSRLGAALPKWAGRVADVFFTGLGVKQTLEAKNPKEFFSGVATTSLAGAGSLDSLRIMRLEREAKAIEKSKPFVNILRFTGPTERQGVDILSGEIKIQPKGFLDRLLLVRPQTVKLDTLQPWFSTERGMIIEGGLGSRNVIKENIFSRGGTIETDMFEISGPSTNIEPGIQVRETPGGKAKIRIEKMNPMQYGASLVKSGKLDFIDIADISGRGRFMAPKPEYPELRGGIQINPKIVGTPQEAITTSHEIFHSKTPGLSKLSDKLLGTESRSGIPYIKYLLRPDELGARLYSKLPGGTTFLKAEYIKPKATFIRKEMPYQTVFSELKAKRIGGFTGRWKEVKKGGNIRFEFIPGMKFNPTPGSFEWYARQRELGKSERKINRLVVDAVKKGIKPVGEVPFKVRTDLPFVRDNEGYYFYYSPGNKALATKLVEGKLKNPVEIGKAFGFRDEEISSFVNRPNPFMAPSRVKDIPSKVRVSYVKPSIEKKVVIIGTPDFLKGVPIKGIYSAISRKAEENTYDIISGKLTKERIYKRYPTGPNSLTTGIRKQILRPDTSGRMLVIKGKYDPVKVSTEGTASTKKDFDNWMTGTGISEPDLTLTTTSVSPVTTVNIQTQQGANLGSLDLIKSVKVEAPAKSASLIPGNILVGGKTDKLSQNTYGFGYSGAYKEDLTQLGTTTDLIQINVPKEIQRVKQNQLLKTFQVPKEAQLVKQNQLLGTSQVPKEVLLVKQNQLLRTSQIPKEVQLVKQNQLLRTSQSPRQINSYIPIIVPPIKSKSNQPALPKVKKKAQSFLVVSRKFKSPFLLSSKPLRKGEALALGLKHTKRGEAASFQLVPTTKSAQTLGLAPISEQTLWGAGYRPSVRKGRIQSSSLTFVQRRRTRMGTPMEVRAIQSFKGRSIW